ncbi:MAG: hypothetical protein M1830_009490 [Pleopsidium flavum]|nr:MAG: hypothetical protein M1830_009490 [Pleopsidium flavum]
MEADAIHGGSMATWKVWRCRALRIILDLMPSSGQQLTPDKVAIKVQAIDAKPGVQFVEWKDGLPTNQLRQDDEAKRVWLEGILGVLLGLGQSTSKLQLYTDEAWIDFACVIG